MPHILIRARTVRPRTVPLLALLLLSSCAGRTQAGTTPPTPTCPHLPPIPDGKPPKPPLSALPQVLNPGHWEWDASGYVWQPPQWQAKLTKHPPVWLDGYWEPNGGACVWHNGRFLHDTGVK